MLQCGEAAGSSTMRLPPPTPVSDPDFSGFELLSPPQGVTAPRTVDLWWGGDAVSYTHLTLPTICSV
eukprot:4983111-Alexandrium_andersonii.AAC.1